MSEAAWAAVFNEEGGEACKLAGGIREKIIAAAQATEEGDTLPAVAACCSKG